MASERGVPVWLPLDAPDEERVEGRWYPLDDDGPAQRVEELEKRLAEVETERDEAIDDAIKEGAEVLELREAASPVLGWLDTLASRIIGETVPARCERDAETLRALLGEGAEDAD